MDGQDTHPASPFTYTNPVRESHNCYRPASYTYYTIRILRVLPVPKYTEYLDLYRTTVYNPTLTTYVVPA
eukprot:COSAG02_NODE_8309_length_2622_cov_99.290527_4_plen_70_part_00